MLLCHITYTYTSTRNGLKSQKHGVVEYLRQEKIETRAEFEKLKEDITSELIAFQKTHKTMTRKELGVTNIIYFEIK